MFHKLCYIRGMLTLRFCLSFKSIMTAVLTAHLLAGSPALAQHFNLIEVKKLVNSFMASSGVSGVAISLIRKGTHEELYFGSAGRGDKGPVTDQTLFEIGSITKVFTPHLMVVAQEEGKISINDPVSKYIPVLKANPVFNQISLKDLATHTSALPGIFDTPKNLKSRHEVIQWLLQWKPSFPPKSQYLYSNIGIALIGFVLEEVYYQNWDRLLTTKILLPRKMTSTFQNVPTEESARIAQGFDFHQKPTDLLSKTWLFYPAGALKSNASDLGAYVASWDKGFFKYLKESVCFINHSCQGLGIEVHPLTDLSQDFVNVQFTVDKVLDPSVRKEERLPPLSQVFIDKTGSSDGMSAYIALIPSSGVGVVILCNQWNVGERVSLGRKILSISQ